MEQMDQQEQEIANLERQLREASIAENFFDTASGKLSVELATKEIDKIVKDICSDKFLNDHRGYVVEVLRLQARRDWLKKLQISASPIRVRKIQEKLGGYEQS